MKGKKIKPKNNNNRFEWRHYSGIYGDKSFVYPVGSKLEKKDNNRWARVSGSYWGRACIRIPSIKKGMRVWKNFYRLFPHVYNLMREYVDYYNLKEGDVFTLRAHFGSKWSCRCLKMKVVDMEDEIVVIDEKGNRFHMFSHFSDSDIERYLESGVMKKIKDIKE